MKIIVNGEVVDVKPDFKSMNLAGVVIDPVALDKLKKVNQEALYIGWGVRCFNGAFDSKTMAVFDYQAKVLKLVQSVVPNITVTYFPMGAFYLGGQNYLACTREHSTRGGVLGELVNRLLAHAAKGEHSETLPG